MSIKGAIRMLTHLGPKPIASRTKIIALWYLDNLMVIIFTLLHALLLQDYQIDFSTRSSASHPESPHRLWGLHSMDNKKRLKCCWDQITKKA
jgi:hypothetical protein